jgi:hypothetical protein
LVAQFTLREERRLKLLENKVQRRMFRSEWDEVRGEWKKLHKEELNDRTAHPILFG